MLIAARTSESFACVLITLGIKLCQPVLSQLCYWRQVMARGKKKDVAISLFLDRAYPWEEKWHETVQTIFKQLHNATHLF